MKKNKVMTGIMTAAIALLSKVYGNECLGVELAYGVIYEPPTEEINRKVLSNFFMIMAIPLILLIGLIVFFAKNKMTKKSKIIAISISVIIFITLAVIVYTACSPVM